MERKQALLGLASIAVALLVAGGIYYLGFGTALVEPFAAGTAQGLARLIQVFGLDASASGVVVNSGDVAVSIAPGCTPIAPVLLYLGAVVGYPSGWGAKGKGALLGITALTLINFIRVATLLLVVKYSPESVAVTHVIVWQSLLVVVTVAIWLYWVQRYARRAES